MPRSKLEQRSRRVLDLASEAGFALAGIAPATASEHADHVRQWLAEGQHGEMHYLDNHLAKRLDPAALLPGAKAVICVADRYEGEAPRHQGTGAPTGKVARYAWGADYHKTIKKRLHHLADALAADHPDEEFKTTVDTAPTLEREHATRAGLGWIGKHTLLIHPQQGSWLLLGTIITTLQLAESEAMSWPDETVEPNDHCGTCTRCIDACPTDCITPYAVDGSRCISYLTLEHRTPINPDLHEAMGDWIAGCDICQEVCPHNRPRPRNFPPVGAEMQTTDFDLLAILDWTEADRREAFRGSALKRIKLDMFKRNALIALGNQKVDDKLRERFKSIATDESETDLVRITAKQVLDRQAHGNA